MVITSATVANQLAAYLQHRISLDELVDWAERVLLEGEIAEKDFEATRDTVARLGVSDVRAFGLTWEDCETMLRRLGYTAQVEVSAA